MEKMSKTEYDLEKISNTFTRILKEFKELEYEKNLTSINHKLFDFRTSYLAPTYHLNRFDKATEEYFKIDLPNTFSKGVIDENDMNLLAIKLHLEFNAVLYSIKMSLDRIVFFMSKFYKGITPHNTFGRINDNGKPRSMMAEVVRLKDSDKIMELIFKNYSEWISNAIKPRDTITHYENLTLSFLQLDNSKFAPVFSHREKQIESLGREELKKYIDKWYIFINKLFELILIEKIKTTNNNT